MPMTTDDRGGARSSRRTQQFNDLAYRGLLPTPKASDSTRGDCPGEQRRKSPTLASVAKHLPTPTTGGTGYVSGDGKWRPTLETAARKGLLPTPTVSGNANRKGASAASGDGLRTVVGGRLNPPFVEQMMGWPVGWTASEPVETESFRRWQREHSLCCSENSSERG